MKKLVGCMILLFCFLLGGTVAHAAVGDVIGNIYATDIVTYLNGMKIPSYNIGGETVIVVEDLERYGFQVEWYEESRCLSANASCMPETAPEYVPKKNNNSPGKMIGNIYETDIRVSINESNVEKEHIYNIGGKIAVEVSAISEIDPNKASYGPFRTNGYSAYGFRFVWHPEKRTVEMEAMMGGKEIQTDFGTFPLDLLSIQYPYVSNYTGNKDAYQLYEMISGISDFEGNNIFYFSYDAQYGHNKYMNLRPLLEIADVTVKGREGNMLVLEKGIKQSLHTYEDKDPFCTKAQQYILGSVTLKSSNHPEKEFSALVYEGEIYIEEKDIAEFIGMPFSYTCVGGWIDGKVIDKVVTP